MKTQYSYKNLSAQEEAGFTAYVEKKLKAIEQLVQKYDDDASIFQAQLEKFEKHSAFSTEFILRLPSKTFVSSEASHSLQKSVDLAKDRLVTQLKKYLSDLNDRKHRALKQKKEDFLSQSIGAHFVSEAI